MKKRIIAIDCDDVIVETAPLLLRHYNKTYGTDMMLRDLYSRNLAIWDVADEATAVKRVNDYMLSAEYRNALPLREAIEVVRQLSEQHELHVVTGRSDFLAAATREMLRQYFPDMFKSVEFTNFFGEKPRPKAQICQELGADLLIDDHLHHALTVATCGIEVLLFGHYPWNQADYLPANVQRVRGWPEVASYLLPDSA